MSVLVIGDFHIPDRAAEMPSELKDLLAKKKFNLVLSPGDFTEEFVLKRVESIGNLVAVRGNMDSLDLPKSQTCQFGSFRVGVIHGNGIYPRGDVDKLSSVADHMKVDVLVSGHTHKLHVEEIRTPAGRSVLLLNPGSATGVWSGGVASLIPSLITLKISPTSIAIVSHELKRGDVISKTSEFRK